MKKQQKALPICIIPPIFALKATELQQAMGKLLGTAYVWAIHSCDHSKVSKAKQRQTKQLCHQTLPLFNKE
jgi:hypothetical protein